MSSIVFNKSKDLKGTNNIKEKIMYMEEAIHMEYEKNSIFRYILADVYGLDKQYDKALTAIERAIELTPDRWEYWYEKQNIL
jgi:tetratricopeptide (TPR) repeat protein